MTRWSTSGCSGGPRSAWRWRATPCRSSCSTAARSFSVGLAPVYALTTEIIVASVPPERAGTASAITETGAELGGALGIAVLGSLGVAVYRHLMSHAALPPQAAGESGGTIGSAAAFARTLPPASGQSLMTAAARAFTQAFAVMSGASAVLIAVVTLVAFRLMR